MRRLLWVLFAVVPLALFAAGESESRSFVTIGTGGVTGVYYPTGGAISRIINSKIDEYGIRMTVESTGGSVYNVNAVLSGDLDFGIAQSDRQFQAINGLAEWQDSGPQSRLRSVFSIHPESITLVATANSDIRDVRDLQGFRVNIGNPGSGQIQNARDIFQAIGLSENDIEAEQIKAAEAPGLVQDGRLDAFFFTVGHPNGTILEATAGRVKVRFVPIEGPEIDALLTATPYYAKSRIPISQYPQAEGTSDVDTIGVKATLVTSADVDADIVYAVTKEVFENFEEFKALHPAYQTLEREDLLTGLSAPVHAGAKRYYEESGLDSLIPPELLIE